MVFFFKSCSSIEKMQWGLSRAFSFPGWQPKFFQVVILSAMFKTSDHLHGPPLDPLCIFLMLRTPDLYTARQVGPHKGSVEGGQSPPLTCWMKLFWCSPEWSWLSGLQVHIDGSCPTFHPPEPLSPSPQGCSPWVLLLVCIHAWDCPDPGADLALGLLELC